MSSSGSYYRSSSSSSSSSRYSTGYAEPKSTLEILKILPTSITDHFSSGGRYTSTSSRQSSSSSSYGASYAGSSRSSSSYSSKPGKPVITYGGSSTNTGPRSTGGQDVGYWR
ncbi:hypothetical protein EV356DRAFT_566447 [Viridothelium virens]|uniref:Uncharacterized protein n=1 Tax=Viridothelium virens TaxID=1048519 RepID=A0A6A6HB73_VIRVR|nr:hypothetical protein EV356DRAFT_566447 [Viridothelium virens]